ncbi:MAG: LysR family transcriptional regulator [Paracoccaceae bacterium]|nr:LysR family transcriptional regulator [Paracoccaceae bacterium]MDG1739414.1 LysR family transcriptional regulator [Paracoccaceae bacterium]MDG2258668.1 LysR family transcriptional regulator [Paracoccaceae bacterium]
MIDKLEMYLALAKTRHFGKAAEEIGVTQPTLSAAIKQLEEQLGVMLVYRGSRFKGLTPEGQRVQEWARQIVSDARSMKEEMRFAHQGLSGNLRLAVIPTALTASSDLTALFVKRHPNVRLSILSRSSTQILEMMDNLEIDAGISYLDDEPLGRVVSEPLYSEKYVLVTSQPMPTKNIGWDELGEMQLCLLTPDMLNRRIINLHLKNAGVQVQPEIEANTITVLISHVLSGNWATILPVKAAEIYLSGMPLHAVPIIKPDASHRVGLIAPYQEPHTPVIAALLSEAKTLARKWAKQN